MNVQKKNFARNISSTFLVQIANYVFPMISVPIIVRIIGPERYGLINYSAAIVMYFTLLINYSFSFTAAREVAQSKSDPRKISRIFSEVFAAKVFLFGVSSLIFFSCFLIFPVFKENSRLLLSTYLICAAWVITPDWFNQGMGELHWTAIFNLVTKVIFTVLILSIIKTPGDYFWQPLAYSLSQFVVAIFSWRWSSARYGLKLTLPTFKTILNLIYNDRMVFFSSVVISLYTSTNIVILAYVVGALEVGYFTAAQKFILISQSILTIPLAQSVFPLVSHSFGESVESGIKMVKKITPFVAMVTFIAGVGMMIVGPWLIELYYGPQFDNSKIMFRIMAFIPFVISISNLYGIQVMLNMRMDKIFLRIVISGAIFSLLLNALMAKKLSGVGSSISWLVTEIFITVSMGIYLYRKNIQIFSLSSIQAAFSIKQFYNNILKANKS